MTSRIKHEHKTSRIVKLKAGTFEICKCGHIRRKPKKAWRYP